MLLQSFNTSESIYRSFFSSEALIVIEKSESTDSNNNQKRNKNENFIEFLISISPS